VPTESMGNVLGEVDGEIKVEYWIGVEDDLIRRVDVEMELFEVGGDQQELNATLSFLFSEFNKEITIEAP